MVSARISWIGTHTSILARAWWKEYTRGWVKKTEIQAVILLFTSWGERAGTWPLAVCLWKRDNSHLMCGLWGLNGIIHVKHLAGAWNMVWCLNSISFLTSPSRWVPWIRMQLSLQDKLAQPSLILWLPCSKYCDCAGNTMLCPQGAQLPNVCHLLLPPFKSGNCIYSKLSTSHFLWWD